VKRLFPLSGNRCAFPKCQVAIAEGTSLVGEICHIKADKPGGPRYDPTQTDEERQSFYNLILMCANHHKVVDDDEESHSVARLQKLKAEHESRAAPASNIKENDAIISLLIEHSMLSLGQTGGIAAHTLNAQNIYLTNAPSDATTAKKPMLSIRFGELSSDSKPNLAPFCSSTPSIRLMSLMSSSRDKIRSVSSKVSGPMKIYPVFPPRCRRSCRRTVICTGSTSVRGSGHYMK
jgi:hypothetical protein